jgi:hypothetical protein
MNERVQHSRAFSSNAILDQKDASNGKIRADAQEFALFAVTSVPHCLKVAIPLQDLHDGFVGARL